MNRKERRAAEKTGTGASVVRPAELVRLWQDAIAHHQAGRPADARALYTKVLAVDPDNAECHYYIGLAYWQLQRVNDAATHYARAVGLKPDYAEAHTNLGNALHAQGKLAEATQCYERAIALNGRDVAARYNLANVLAQQGQVDAAIAQFQAALDIDPKLFQAHNNLANVLMAQGRHDEAATHYRRALAVNPGLVEACMNLGNMLAFQGKHDEAILQYRRSVELKPDYAEAHNNLGVALAVRGEVDQAAAAYQRASTLKPDFIDAYNNLARLLLGAGDPTQAIAVLRRALQVKEAPATKTLIMECLVEPRALPDLGAVRDLVLRALAESWGRPSDLAKTASQLLKANVALRPGIAQANAAWPPRFAAADVQDMVAAAAGDPLLLHVLETGPVCDPEFERYLTAHRLALLDAAEAASPGDDSILAFRTALARQCFINEYVFAVSVAEQERVRGLRDKLAAALESSADVSPLHLIAVAAYAPLHALPGAERLLQRPWPAPVKALLVEQVQEPQAEQALRAAIPALTPIEDSVSQAVRAQYEDNPYPRWVKAAPIAASPSLEDYLRRKFPLAPLRNTAKGKLDILIAGCGTGQQALEAAARYGSANILAVDLSLTSLSYARRKAGEQGADIAFAQADILGLGSTGKTFDVIESSGVLHHLADPMAGWRVLLSLLRPHGVMRLGLYSKVARHHISAARAAIAERGYGSSADDIRRCRQELMSLDAGQLFANISASVDFYTLSSCRDLLFHVQEHQLTLPEIAEFLAQHGLEFLGFELDPALLQQYAQAHRDDPGARDLARWDAFERTYPQIFAGMYQFWVQKRG